MAKRYGVVHKDSKEIVNIVHAPDDLPPQVADRDAHDVVEVDHNARIGDVHGRRKRGAEQPEGEQPSFVPDVETTVTPPHQTRVHTDVADEAAEKLHRPLKTELVEGVVADQDTPKDRLKDAEAEAKANAKAQRGHGR